MEKTSMENNKPWQGYLIYVALNERNQLLAIISWHVQSWSLHERKNAIAHGLPMPPGWLLILAFKLKAHDILGIHTYRMPINWAPRAFPHANASDEVPDISL